QTELGDAESLGERDAREHERAGRGRLGDPVVRGRRDLAVREELGETRGLRRRDDARVAAPFAPTGRRDLAEEDVEAAGVGRDAAPAEPHRVTAGTDARAAAIRGGALELVAGNVGRRERAHRQALLAELLSALLGLRLVRVARELELDGIFEHHGRAVGKVVEQRRGRAERGGERVEAGRVAALAQRVDERRVRTEVLALAGSSHALPTGG